MSDIDVSITQGQIIVAELNRGYSGFSGRSGYSGFSGNNPGTSGYSGLSGFSGLSGKSGYSGFSGSGYSGFSGRSGYSGYSGTGGSSGVSGYSGFSGKSGYSGFSGTLAGTPTVYVALLTQTSTNAPVATVLVNTLGGTPTWGYTSVGVYTATLTGVFTAAKTGVFISPLPHLSATATQIAEYQHTSADVITIQTMSQDGTNSLSNLANGRLTDTMIRIEVYP